MQRLNGPLPIYWGKRAAVRLNNTIMSRPTTSSAVLQLVTSAPVASADPKLFAPYPEEVVKRCYRMDVTADNRVTVKRTLITVERVEVEMPADRDDVDLAALFEQAKRKHDADQSSCKRRTTGDELVPARRSQRLAANK